MTPMSENPVAVTQALRAALTEAADNAGSFEAGEVVVSYDDALRIALAGQPELVEQAAALCDRAAGQWARSDMGHHIAGSYRCTAEQIRALAQSPAAGLEREADGAPGGGMGVSQAWIDRAAAIESAARALLEGVDDLFKRADAGSGRLYAANRNVLEDRCDQLASAVNTPEPTFAALTKPMPPASVSGEVVVPTTCDGIEQDAFEAWAASERFVMDTHPLHWLFLNAETNAARKGWKAGLMHCRERMLAAAPEAATHIAEHLTVANATPSAVLDRDFKALRRDYGRAALLINIMRERWETVAQALNDIEGGMHADLEDAASAMATACDEPARTIAAALNEQPRTSESPK